jgi:predicted kinase
MPLSHPPRLIVISGLPGTGKTRLAEALSLQLDVPVFSVAWVLGALAPFGVLEQPDRGAKAYAIITSLVEHRLRLGRSAIVDGMVGSDEVRTRWMKLAAGNGGAFKVIECVCSDPELHRARIEARAESIPGWPDPGWDHVQAMRERYVPWRMERLVLDSVLPYEENLLAAMRFAGGR